MKLESKMPDYQNSILNLVQSILKYYQVKTDYPSLEWLDTILNKKYQNVALVIIDGMGEDLLQKLSPNGLFEKQKKQVITSVFPPTTAAAMTTYYSGKPPIETGWIAWSQYFKEYGRAIDILQKKDSQTGEVIDFSKTRLDFKEIMGYQTIFEQIRRKSPNIKQYEIAPSYVEKQADRLIQAQTVEEMADNLLSLCQKKGEKFIFSYVDQPDSLIHQFGCEAEETKQWIKKTEISFEKIQEKLKGTNSLLIVCADHGLIDIASYSSILSFPTLQECFLMPSCLESRTISFWIKPEKKRVFEKEFSKLFGDQYLVYTKQEFLQTGLLGMGKKHPKIDDFLGDYLAIAISDKAIQLETYLTPMKQDSKKATHCGMTKKEMEVPCIVFEQR